MGHPPPPQPFPSDTANAFPSAPPPPYTPSPAYQQSAYQQPTYQQPAYNQPFNQAPPQQPYAPAIPGPASSSSSAPPFQPHPTKLPPTLNAYYQWKFTRTFHLGPAADQKLYAVAPRSSLSCLKHALLLHDGPTTDAHPVLAQIESEGLSGRSYVVTIHPGRGDGGSVVERLSRASSLTHRTASFSIGVRGGGGGGEKGARRERFEWRPSRGAEIKDLAGSLSHGWKLVRCDAEERWDGVGQRGVASDGKEVVAVIAHNASWSMTKGLRFALMGTGCAGVLGEEWEVMALVTGLQLWYRDVQESSAAGAS